MTSETLKGWLVLPEFSIKASEITSLMKHDAPTKEEIKICPGFAKIKAHVQISQKNQKGVMTTYEPYDKVMKLFQEALKETPNDG
jgi:hypothetical protein